MEEKKKTNPLIAILIILVLALSSYIVYDEFFKVNTNKESTNKKEETKEEKIIYKDYQEEETFGEDKAVMNYKFSPNENYVSTVPLKDLFSLANYEEELEYAVIYNGKVYYYDTTGTKVYSNIDNVDLKELKGLTGKVKRIKTVNFTSGLSYDQLLIMEDGSVYRLFIEKDNTRFYKEDELSKYKVDDVISWEVSFPAGSVYKVILTDGTILEKTIKYIS